MDFNTDLGQATKLGARLTVLAMAVALAACGGGGASDAVNTPSSSQPTTPVTPPPATNNLKASFEFGEKNAFDVAGSELAINVRVVNLTSNSTAAGATVSLGLADAAVKGVSIIGSPSVVTNDEGIASFRLLLNQAATPELKAKLISEGVTISAVTRATNGALSLPTTQVVRVLEGSEQVDSNLSLRLDTDRAAVKPAGGSFVVTSKVIDENGGGVKGQAVTLAITDALKNNVTIKGASTATTDENGEAKFTIVFAPTASTDINALMRTGIAMAAVLVSDTAVRTTINVAVVADLLEDVTISVSQNDASLNTGGGSTELNLRVTDARGGVMAGIPVVLNIVDKTRSGATFDTASTIVTDAFGIAKTRVVIDGNRNILDFRFNRDVAVVASVLDANANIVTSQNITIPVLGTAVTLDANQTVIKAGESLTVTVTARDGQGNALVNSRVQLLDEAGAAIGHPEVRTTAQGKAVIVLGPNLLVPNQQGQVIIGGRAFGTSVGVQQDAQVPLRIAASDQDFSFTQVGGTFGVNQTAQIKLQVRGLQQSEVIGKEIELLTTQGRLDAQKKTINTAQLVNGIYVGEVVFDLVSDSPGLANLSAFLGDVRLTGQVNFISRTAAKLILQADETILVPSASTPVRVVVKDSNDAPVQGIRVLFSRGNDASAGSLSSPEAMTDASGVATVTYTAGQTPTPLGGVTLNARIENAQLTVNEGTINLTVAEQAAFITLSFSNKLEVDREIFYKMPVAAAVVDNVGRPVANQLVSLSLTPTHYLKGRWEVKRLGFGDDFDQEWRRTPYINEIIRDEDGFITDFYPQLPPVVCESEDSNRNAIKDAGEDVNGNGILDPRNPVIIVDANGNTVGANGRAELRTNAEGKLFFQLHYGKNFAEWLRMDIRASTRVQGTEFFHKANIGLPALLSDLTIFSDGLNQRPNTDSPYGLFVGSGACANKD